MGKQEWLVDTAGRYISESVAVDEEVVYVGHAPYNTLGDPTINRAKVFRFDRESGAKNWSFETPALEVGSSPVLTGDMLYVGTHRWSDGDGVGVHAITTDGQGRWFTEIDGRGVGSSPALAGGRLYFDGTGAKVYIVE